MSDTAGAHATPGIADSDHAHAAPHGKQLLWLSLGALGVVFGDIGTSPLYALRECLHGQHGIPVATDNVLGVLSLIFWRSEEHTSELQSQ